MNSLNQLLAGVSALASSFKHNHYRLNLTQLHSAISVLSVQSHGALNQPWRYDITFTSADKQIAVDSVLSQSASFTFLVPAILQQVSQISSLDKPAIACTLYGVVTEFSQLSVNHDEAHYREVLQPRLTKPYTGDTYGFHFPLIDDNGRIGFSDWH